MKTITITQTYEVKLPSEAETWTKEYLINTLNHMYDIQGKDIIKSLSADNEYSHTILTEIDNEDVYLDGSLIILDGQQL